MVSGAFAQNISSIEYFVNTDPGFGLGTAITGFSSTANVANLPTSINITSLKDGLNTLYFRSKDANMKWGITNSISFIKQSLANANIVKAEYFFNTDPGFGLATNLVIASSQNINNHSFAVDVSSLEMGINTLYVRTKDNTGNWSITNNSTFVKVERLSNVSAMEYFVDSDPGFGLATAVSISPALNLNNMNFSVDLTSFQIGNHNLFVRSKNANGKWSLTNILNFNKTVLGIHVSEKEKLFTVYPNPTSTNFILQYPIDKKIDAIEMIDLSGKTIAVTESNFENGKQIDASQLAKGTYFIKITSEGNVIYKKVIKN